MGINGYKSTKGWDCEMDGEMDGEADLGGGTWMNMVVF